MRAGRLPIAVVCLVAGCGSNMESGAQFEAGIVGNMHASLLKQLLALNQAARDLQAAAPTPPDRGWDATADQPALQGMRDAWKRMRSAWEAVEGAVGPMFPDLDAALDGRYEEYLATLGAAGDPDPFDGQGVTGMHAIERILWAHVIPADVVTRESALAGYQPAAWPASADQAAELKTGLCAELVSDSQSLVDQWKPRAIDLASAFLGLTQLMNEQEEKVSLAASHEEESRYSQRTLADLQANLTGTEEIFSLFEDWLQSLPDGALIDGGVQKAFDRLTSTYTAASAASISINGADAAEALPPPPPEWDTMHPSIADQQTDFGKLYVSVVLEVDPNIVGSAVDAMNHVADALGLQPYTGQN